MDGRTVALIIRRAEVGARHGTPGSIVDVAVACAGGDETATSVGTIVAVGAGLDLRGAVEIDGRGAALIPGLHDHHLHLLAVAAARSSIDVGHGAVTGLDELGQRLAAAGQRLRHGQRLRVVGYHESIAGDLDRDLLDGLVGDRPVRVGDRGGARWTLNSAALAELATLDHPAVELDDHGRATGRIHRGDDLLGSAAGHRPELDLAGTGDELTGWGVTGVTDATPFTSLDGPGLLADARRRGEIRQAITICGSAALVDATIPGPLHRGPVKLVIDDAAYPDPDELAVDIAAARRAGRAVAFHCVTRTALVVALAALDVAPKGPGGDRIEHGAVIPPELFAAIRAAQLTVVTQPGFIAERGDDYRRDVDAADRPHLYRCASLRRAGIPVAGSTDAPYTNLNPWAAIAAANDRRTRDGVIVGRTERLNRHRALELFLGRPESPGGPPRRVAVGQPANLCLLDVGLGAALAEPDANHVVATVIDGQVIERTAHCSGHVHLGDTW